MSKVRQKDLAKAANVSVSTVSLALRDHPSISAATKRKVAELQKKIGYQPSRTSSPPSERPRLLFCLLRRALNSPLYNPFLEGVVTACKQLRSPLDIDFVRVDEDISEHPFQAQNGAPPDGIIFAGAVTEEIVNRGKAEASHVVVLGTHHLNEPVHRVDLDLNAMARMIARRVIADGNRAAFLVTIPSDDYNRDLAHALKEALQNEGLPILPRNTFTLNPNETDVSAVASAVVSHKGPVAVVTSALFISQGLLAQIPGRKSAIKHYSILVDETPQPGIIGINPGQKRLGMVGVDLLHALHSKETNYTGPFTTLLPPVGWVEPPSVSR